MHAFGRNQVLFWASGGLRASLLVAAKFKPKSLMRWGSDARRTHAHLSQPLFTFHSCGNP